MKTTFSYLSCFLISICLFSVQLTTSYEHLADITVELPDSGEESPVEDTLDAEQELEVEKPNTDSDIRTQIEKNDGSSFDFTMILSESANEIPIPPPDHI